MLDILIDHIVELVSPLKRKKAAAMKLAREGSQESVNTLIDITKGDFILRGEFLHIVIVIQS